MIGYYTIMVEGDYQGTVKYSISYSTIKDILIENSTLDKSLEVKGFYKLDPGFPMEFEINKT